MVRVIGWCCIGMKGFSLKAPSRSRRLLSFDVMTVRTDLLNCGVYSLQYGAI